jgi:hypothetical protein
MITAIENFATFNEDSTSDNSEMTVNGLIDSMLNVVCMSLQKQRDRNSQSTTSGAARPDYSLGAALIGEDKTKSNYLRGNTTEADLKDKTPFEEWEIVYGSEVQFIFGYSAVCCASDVQFTLGAMDRHSKKFVSFIYSVN